MNVVIEKKENLEAETAKRVAKVKKEFSAPLKIKAFENTENYDQLISQIGITAAAECEHHEIQFQGDVSVGYLPGKQLVGLSKIPRIVEKFMNPSVKTLQERVTQQIIEAVKKYTKSDTVMVIVRARHGCMAYRGVKKSPITVTSAISGAFKDDLGLRQEFIQYSHLNSEKI